MIWKWETRGNLPRQNDSGRSGGFSEPVDERAVIAQLRAGKYVVLSLCLAWKSGDVVGVQTVKSLTKAFGSWPSFVTSVPRCVLVLAADALFRGLGHWRGNRASVVGFSIRQPSLHHPSAGRLSLRKHTDRAWPSAPIWTFPKLCPSAYQTLQTV